MPHLSPTQAPVPFLNITLDRVGINSPGTRLLHFSSLTDLSFPAATPIVHFPPRHLLNTPQPAVVTPPSRQIDPGRELKAMAASGQAPSLQSSIGATMSLDPPGTRRSCNFCNSFLIASSAASPASHSTPTQLRGQGINSPGTCFFYYFLFLNLRSFCSIQRHRFFMHPNFIRSMYLHRL